MNRLLEGFFDLPTIVWGGIWSVFWAVTVHFTMKEWKRLSPGQQYLLACSSFTIVTSAPIFLFGWFISLHFGVYSMALTILIPLQLLWGFSGRQERPLRRFMNKHFTVRILWQNDRQRKCNNCGYYDTRTRITSLPATRYYESAYAPCESCGSTDFTFFYLDGSPSHKSA